MTVFDEVRLIAFIAATAALIFVSRRTILSFRSHGFYRFLAWEAITALIFWNLPYWFSWPLSAMQLISWIVLIASLFVLWQGVSLLRRVKRSGRRHDKELYDFERTSELVTSGIYRYIRHPLYASLLYLAIGACLKDVSWISVILLIMAVIALYATARSDEKECIEFFGQEYKDYMEGTKRFIPFIF